METASAGGVSQKEFKIELTGTMTDFSEALGEFNQKAVNQKAFIDQLVKLYGYYTVNKSRIRKPFKEYAKQEMRELESVFISNMENKKRSPDKEVKRMAKVLANMGVIRNRTPEMEMAHAMGMNYGGYDMPMNYGGYDMPMNYGGMAQWGLSQEAFREIRGNPMMIFQYFPQLGNLFNEFCKTKVGDERDMAREKLNMSTELSTRILEYNKFCNMKKDYLEGKKNSGFSLNHIEIQLLKIKAQILELSGKLGLQAF
jgi:hypothetical protein